MMGFDTDEASVYQIRLRHRHQGVRELIPSDYGGVMRTDRALTYDAWALELVAQQKCCYHIIRSIDKVLEDKAGSARAFGETLKTSFKDAIALWQRYHAGEVDDYTREAQSITQAIATVLGRPRQPTPARPNWLASRRGQSAALPRSVMVIFEVIG